MGYSDKFAHKMRKVLWFTEHHIGQHEMPKRVNIEKNSDKSFLVFSCNPPPPHFGSLGLVYPTLPSFNMGNIGEVSQTGKDDINGLKSNKNALYVKIECLKHHSKLYKPINLNLNLLIVIQIYVLSMN